MSPPEPGPETHNRKAQPTRSDSERRDLSPWKFNDFPTFTINFTIFLNAVLF